MTEIFLSDVERFLPYIKKGKEGKYREDDIGSETRAIKVAIVDYPVLQTQRDIGGEVSIGRTEGTRQSKKKKKV